MFKKFFRRMLTRPPSVHGEFIRKADGSLVDSELGSLRRTDDEPDSPFQCLLNIDDHHDVSLSLGDSGELASDLSYLRTVVAAIKMHDKRFRLFAARDVSEFHQLLYKGPKLRPDDFAKHLKLSWIQLLLAADPNLGANLWYSCDGLIPNASVCVTLDHRVRYHSGGVG